MQELLRLSQALDPALLFEDATGHAPDDWQQKTLRSEAPRVLLNCGRQLGKSTVTAVLALHVALFQPGSLVLLLSPSLRQSSELFRKVTAAYHTLGRPVEPEGETALTLSLVHGSRMVSLPGSEATTRGFSGPALVVLDEGARVSDELFYATLPMLSVSGGRLVALSTPCGKRGWFYKAWAEETGWERVEVPASRCPRMKPEFLAQARQSLGERWYRQEFECSFEEMQDAVFFAGDIAAALSDEVEPLPP